MGVVYGCFLKIGVPPNHLFQRGFSVINHPFWGTPIFGNTHMPMGFNPQMATEIRGVSVASPFPKQLHPGASREALDRQRSRLAASELQAWRVEAVRQVSMQRVWTWSLGRFFWKCTSWGGLDWGGPNSHRNNEKVWLEDFGRLLLGAGYWM